MARGILIWATAALACHVWGGGRMNSLVPQTAHVVQQVKVQPTRIRRDWNRYPAVIQLDTDEDIFAVGDPHADYDRLAAVLTGAKLIAGKPARPEKVDWIAGKAIVVFTGDYIDKGSQSLKTIALLRALKRVAADSGGQIIILMGNHEAEFLSSPGERKVKKFADELESTGLHKEDVAACNGDLGEFLCSLPFAARVNDWFFSHAGNTAGRTIDDLTRDLQAGVEKDGFKEITQDDNSLLEARLGDHPWFERKNADERNTLTRYASALNVAHIVQGHQPGGVRFADGIKRKKGEMFQRYGLIFLEDTGMSEGVDYSDGAVLRIPGKNHQRAIAICSDGIQKEIWNQNQPTDWSKSKPCRSK